MKKSTTNDNTPDVAGNQATPNPERSTDSNSDIDQHAMQNPQPDVIPDTQPEVNQPTNLALDAANAQIAELTNDLQRTRADFENYRKQIEMQKSQAAMIAKFAVVNKFLPLIDNFERAIQSYPEQLAPLAKSFEKSLKEVGLQRIDSEPGTEFNPDLHEAVMMEEGDGDTDVEAITETLRPGYTYEGSVVRTAMVKVKH